MSFFGKKHKKTKSIESMTSTERDMIIRRLEKERKKVNSEIESILKSYSKESGNKALRPKRFGRRRRPNDFDFTE